MCGIIAFVKTGSTGLPVREVTAGKTVRLCLERLEYRGYDSVGVACVSSGKLVVRKGKGRIAAVSASQNFDELDSDIVMGHTRWATHGKPSDANAHPHTDCKDQVAVIHNGIISNYAELKKELQRRGHVFKSDTDTEVFAHIVEEKLDEGFEPFDAFLSAVNTIQGSYALVVLCTQAPDRVFFSRKNSPLVLGVSDNATYVSSDIPSFLEYTNRVIVLDDDEAGYASVNGEIVVVSVVNGKRINTEARLRTVSWTPELARKGGYPHYMLKEIYEQPQVLHETIESIEHSRSLSEAATIVAQAENIYLLAAGTAYHASTAARDALLLFSKRPGLPVVSSEYQLHSESVRKGDVVVAVSQSGETIDTLLGARAFKSRGAKVIAVSNILDSALARESDLALYTKAGPELGVAATKTFVTQVALLETLAAMVGLVSKQLDESDVKDFQTGMRQSPALLERNINLSEPRTRELARFISREASMYCLSRGTGVSLAREGALKIKEVSYIHAEAYEAGESKHGPISLVSQGFPVAFVFSDSSASEHMLSNLMEMKSRGAFVIGLIPRDLQATQEMDYAIRLWYSYDYINTMLFAPPLQLLAYYLALQRGLDPDRPRNLAKTVTVE
ncbi:MAG: glutamine--fructose-6-phosphate transaminase (isomerizing) [Thermoprotei archaeon]